MNGEYNLNHLHQAVLSCMLGLMEIKQGKLQIAFSGESYDDTELDCID